MEKRLEIKLPAEVIAPLFDVLNPLAREEDKLAIQPKLTGIDKEFREIWTDDLRAALHSDCGYFLAVFDRPEFRESGVTDFDGAQSEALIRACSALRLKLRLRKLRAITDQELEEGEVDFGKLTRPQQTAMMAYLFLGSLQEILIQQYEASLNEDAGDDADDDDDDEDSESWSDEGFDGGDEDDELGSDGESPGKS